LAKVFAACGDEALLSDLVLQARSEINRLDLR